MGGIPLVTQPSHRFYDKIGGLLAYRTRLHRLSSVPSAFHLT
jgi:hypothetical protein